MRILHVLSPSRYGGLERVVRTLVMAQRDQGDEVHVATLSSDAAALDFLGTLDRRGVGVHPGRAGERDYFAQRTALERLGRALHPDVIHTHGYRADVLAARSARRIGASAVTTLHGFTGGDLKVQCYEWLQRRVVCHCDGIVAVSQAMTDQLTRVGIPAERVHVIPNVIPPPGPRLIRETARRVLGLDAKRWWIGWAGRLSREKGVDLLLEALALTGDPEVGLALLGDGPERPRLERQAAMLGLDDRVTWCGMRPDADRFFSAFDLMVLSSRTEGSPLVLLEAMAANVPIIATQVGGVPETVSPSTALLVPPEDPTSLGAAIRNVRRDPGGAVRRSLRAHVRAARIADPARWAVRYGSVYAAAGAHAEATA